MSAKPVLYSPAMETALAACALADGGVYDLAGVRPEHFHDPMLAHVWRAIAALRDANKDVDSMTVMDQLDAAGSGVTLTELTSLVALQANVAHWESYRDSVLEYAHRRQVSGILTRAVQVVYGANGSYPDRLAAVCDQFTAAVGELRQQQKAREASTKTSWTVAELLAADFPEPPWAVPGLVPVGLTLLAGRPKVGKSWLALQIAHAVGMGGAVLDRRVQAGKVLYLALEDSPRRLQRRMLKQGALASADIKFETSLRRPLANDGMADLAMALAQGGYSLVVIDTLSRALGNVDQDDQAEMNHYMALLQREALDRDLAILVIDHHRKPKGFTEDPIDDILGATAKAASADAALGLFKTQGKAGAVLKVVGRDLEWQELALSWDPAACCWHLEGAVEEIALRGNKMKVLDALRPRLPNAATLSELSALTGISAGNLHPLLAELHDQGLIERLPKQGREVPYRLRAAPEAS